jgi:hypothetical protein
MHACQSRGRTFRPQRPFLRPRAIYTRRVIQESVEVLLLLRERRGTQLDQWIADVQSTGPPELRGFSRNLHRDWLAVHTGFTVQ